MMHGQQNIRFLPCVVWCYVDWCVGIFFFGGGGGSA